MRQPFLDMSDHLGHRGALTHQLRPFDDADAVGHAVGLGVDDMNGELLLGFGMLLIKEIPGQDRGLISAGALGIDRHLDQVGIAGFPGLLKQLRIQDGGHLRGDRQLLGRVDDAVKFLGGNVHAVPVLLFICHNRQGQNGDVQLLTKRLGDIGRGIRGNLDFCHGILLSDGAGQVKREGCEGAFRASLAGSVSAPSARETRGARDPACCS